jgi:hypothetical protein
MNPARESYQDFFSRIYPTRTMSVVNFLLCHLNKGTPAAAFIGPYSVKLYINFQKPLDRIIRLMLI